MLENAPVTTGGEVTLRVEHVSAKLWRFRVDPQGRARDFVLHLPVDANSVMSIRLNGKPVNVAAEIPFRSSGTASTVEVLLK